MFQEPGLSRLNNVGLSLGMSVGKKFHVDIGGGHIDIKSFYLFKRVLIAPAPN
jgi:hypothetical protein